MNFADGALRNRTLTLVLTVVALLGGLVTYQKLSRLEDPEFTIKECLVVTPYPGATPREVEEEVSDRIETAVQQLGQLKEVESRSERGLSTVTVRIKDKYGKNALPQVWDEVRRKVSDVQGQLPPGAGPSVVMDDYGDVWGVFLALHGNEYSPAELKEVAKLLRRELLLVKDVAKIQLWGDRQEVVYVEPDRDRMSQLGIDPEAIARALHAKNVVADAGRVDVGPESIAIEPTGAIRTVQQFGALLISGEPSGRQIYLRDVARVRRGYRDPPRMLLRYDGEPAVGLGISTVSGGNVVVMGEAVEARLHQLLPQIPLGIHLAPISVQSDAVQAAISGFVVSLLEAVAIVVAVLLLFMGVRSGLIIGFILALTISATFIFMDPWHVALERISLGALIIALGMLVDNAIVVVDGMLVRIQKGQPAEAAAREVVQQTAMPLLGATAVAIMAFGAIGLSNDSTGEFCRSLFQVVFLSLSLSWVTAVTVTPVLCVMFLRPPAVGSSQEPYRGAVYRGYGALLRTCLRRRWLTVGVVLALFGISTWGFRYVDRSFFPDSTRPQFMVDFWLPEGTRIEQTALEAQRFEEYLHGLSGVTHVTSLIGSGGLRFLLTYAPEKTDSSYAQFLVDVDDYHRIDGLIQEIEGRAPEIDPNAEVYGKRFILGPGSGGKIQARISGPDPAELRKLASRVEAILRADPDAKSIRTDWRQRVKVFEPVLAEQEANAAGITRVDVSRTLKEAFEGETIGVYREGDELLPIVARAPAPQREDVASAQNLQIWSPAAGRAIPLRQVVSRFATLFQDPLVMRLNRKPTLTVHADPRTGVASAILARIRPQVEKLRLPPGYELAWWGEAKSSADAQRGLSASAPFFALAMVLIVVALFNSLRKPSVIFLTVPLAMIGVTGGLLLTGQPFGFMALLGFLSLSGMLIKNAIVLIDEMDLQVDAGNEPFQAVVDAGASRLRPVAMAALTTALGMIPLLFDAFFVAMAVTIIAGLMVATMLTMVIVPVLYAIAMRIRGPGGS